MLMRRLIRMFRRSHKKIVYEDEDIYVIEHREKNKDPHYIVVLKKPLVIYVDVKKEDESDAYERKD
jgi:diadenosine tetraphosphate (Ap4A) HIT family hydrolase